MSGQAAQKQVRRSFVDGRYGQMHVRAAAPQGGSAKAPVVLLHPAPYSGAYYQDLLERLGADRAAFAVDTPGFGASDAPPAPVDLAAYAAAIGDAVDALLREHPAEAVDLMGFHTGAMIAIELAIQRPDLVRRLVLAGIPFYLGEDRAAVYTKAAHGTLLDEEGGHLRPYWQGIVSDRHPDFPLEAAQQRFNDYMQSCPNSWWTYQAIYSYPTEQRIPLIRQPVQILLMHEVLFEHSKASLAYFSNPHVVDMPELTKNVFDFGGARIAAEMRAFLDADPVP